MTEKSGDRKKWGITRRAAVFGGLAAAAASKIDIRGADAQSSEFEDLERGGYKITIERRGGMIQRIWSGKASLTRQQIDSLNPHHQTVTIHGQEVDAYLFLYPSETSTTSCCDGNDCRIAAAVCINPAERGKEVYLVGTKMSEGDPRFGIAVTDPATLTSKTAVNPIRKGGMLNGQWIQPHEWPDLPHADQPHACMVGGGIPSGEIPAPDSREVLGYVRCLILPSGT